MFASLLVTLREGFEAALIVAIVLAVLRRSGAMERARSVWAGVGAAAVVSAAAGAALFVTGAELEGTAEALFEGVVMLAAAGVLTWMVVWMQRQARTHAAHLQGKVDAALSVGGGALFGFGVYLVWMGVGELGEAIGGEVFEILGPLAAVAYGAIAYVALWRSRRGMGRPNEVPAAGKAT